MTESSHSFGYWVRRRRKALDLTQDALARRASCSTHAIRKIEADERRPSRRLAERLAEHLAVPPDERPAFLTAARSFRSTEHLTIVGQPVASIAIEAGSARQETTSSDAPAPAANHLDEPVFVGRKKEMQELETLLEECLSGHGRIVTLAGEPGIGKTRTSMELTRHGATRGARVLWGRCYEGGGAPPYWPWVEAIRSYASDRDVELLRKEMGLGLSDIAEIVPDLHERAPDIRPPSIADPQQARFRLFDSVLRFIKHAATGQPLLVIFDDLHWADQASLRLLEFVAAGISGSRVLIVCTYRDAEIVRGHPFSQTIAELTRLGLHRRIALRGLDQDDVDRFIGRMSPGVTPSRDLVETVHRQTEGNPLFVTEVLRLLKEEGTLASDRMHIAAGKGLPIPEGVRAVIGRRLSRLSGSCNECLTIASVIGRRFTLQQLALLIDGSSEEDLLRVLEEAMAARVIEEQDDAVGVFQFTHALIGETLSVELSPSRRARMHARIARVLETLFASDPRRHASELARHFAQAVPVLGYERFVRYSLLAGEHALATFANEEALAYFDSALKAKEGDPPDTDTAALLFGRGRAEMATLERHLSRDAVTNLHRAFDTYVGIGDVSGAIAVAEYSFTHFPGHEAAMAPIVKRALEMVPPESPEAGRLLSRYGRILAFNECDYERAQDAFARALVIAERKGDRALEMRTLTSAAYVDYFYRRTQRIGERSTRAISLARELGDLNAEVTARYWIASSLREAGDAKAFEEQVACILPPAERLRNRFWLAGAYWLHENVCRLKGQLQGAREWSDRGFAVSPMDFRLLWTRALLECELGNLSAGDALLTRLCDVMRMTPPGPTPEHGITTIAIALSAAITGNFERVGEAKAAAETVFSMPFRIPVIYSMARVGLAVASSLIGDVRLARDVYPELQGLSGTLAFPAGVSTDRVRGLLAHKLGRLDDADSHFEAARAFCVANGFRPDYAWSAYGQAHVLLDRNDADDLAKARQLLGETLRISHELGMRTLNDRAKGDVESLPA